jgi:hypothetical protein
VIAIGCILRGETAHFDYVASEVARGVLLAQLDTGVPIIFCVLTCDTLEQAIDRAGLKGGNKGHEAAMAAVEMARLSRELSPGPSSGAPARATEVALDGAPQSPANCCRCCFSEMGCCIQDRSRLAERARRSTASSLINYLRMPRRSPNSTR